MNAWRVALEAVSTNLRLTAARKPAVEAAVNGLLSLERYNGIFIVFSM